jgi:hypothetical protein
MTFLNLGDEQYASDNAEHEANTFAEETLLCRRASRRDRANHAEHGRRPHRRSAPHR